MSMLLLMARPWSATHYLTFTPQAGPPETWVVMLAAMPDDEGIRRAHTRDEWLKSAPGSWACTIDGTWTCDGVHTPGDRQGLLTVKETSGGFKKMEWSPTHRITFYPSEGQPRWWMVMARPDAYRPGHWAAMTHEEWFAQCPPEWSCSPQGDWTWKGMATPKDTPGSVHVEEVSGAYPTQAAADDRDARQR